MYPCVCVCACACACVCVCVNDSIADWINDWLANLLVTFHPPTRLPASECGCVYVCHTVLRSVQA